MKKYAVIVAGGEGNRAGGSVPKQFQMLGDVPMLWWSVRAFHEEDSSTEIILVLHPVFSMNGISFILSCRRKTAVSRCV